MKSSVGAWRVAQFCLAGVLFVCTLCLVAPPQADARVSAARALHDLNAMRAAAGVPKVRRLSSTYNRGCRLHNRYMNATGDFGHRERRGSAYYSRLGARAAATSVISMPAALPSSAWGDTVYHRIAMLQPRLRTAGFDGSAGFACMQVTRGISRARGVRLQQPELYPWPANGSTGHASLFAGAESPDPHDDAPGARQLGTPVTVSVNGPWKYWQQVRTRVSSASLIGDIGDFVDVSISDASSPNGGYLQGGFGLLPRRALRAGGWYTATAIGTLNYRGRSWPFSISTRFKTR